MNDKYEKIGEKFACFLGKITIDFAGLKRYDTAQEKRRRKPGTYGRSGRYGKAEQNAIVRAALFLFYHGQLCWPYSSHAPSRGAASRHILSVEMTGRCPVGRRPVF